MGRALFGLMGWRIEGEFPDVAKCVIVIAPHTSNWDFPLGMATVLALGIRAHYIGKHTLFKGAFGRLLRWSGGIPVDRDAPGDIIERTLALFRGSEGLLLAVAPEGTRGKVEHWKRGFHRIAVGASVPILPVAFDYSVRAVRFLPLFTPTGDFHQDLDHLQALFSPQMARHPEHY